MSVQCSICQNKDRVILEDSALNLYKCDSCLHSFSNIPEDKKEPYCESYFLETHKNWFNNPDYGLFAFLYKIILKYTDKERFKLLDAGCGKGDFLKYLKNTDPKIELHGIDLIHNQCSGINFSKGDILKDEIRGKFDVILSLVTIEHIDQPHLFIKKLKNALLPNNLLLITTINSNSMCYRTARLLNKIGVTTPYNRFYSPHHTQHYTNTSLRALMELNDFTVILQRNHNYHLKGVDFPKGNFLKRCIYALGIWIFFSFSTIFKDGMLQTIVCRKNSER
ncbi:class I SAM-dependent methyltransferase [Candidatus Omnitrophota bacterium]